MNGHKSLKVLREVWKQSAGKHFSGILSDLLVSGSPWADAGALSMPTEKGENSVWDL